MIHLIYPHKDKISTPHAIGYKLWRELSVKYEVTVHNYDVFYKIKPKEGDILIGHACPTPLTIFRRSMLEKGWRKIILMQPYSEDIKQVGFIDEIIDHCDEYLAITGKYWFDRVSHSLFKRWAPKMVHLDLAVDPVHFPRLKEGFNPPGSRKFVYVGNDYFYKNLDYLENISKNLKQPIHSIGKVSKKRSFIKHGFVDFKTEYAKNLIKDFDFMITVGDADANPTTILESLSWGLIPVCTPTSGYYQIEGIVNVPLNDVIAAQKVIDNLQMLSEDCLESIRAKGSVALQRQYSWNKFFSTVFDCLERDVKINIYPNTHKFKKNYSQLIDCSIKAILLVFLRLMKIK
jgi:hypothetical protein